MGYERTRTGITHMPTLRLGQMQDKRELGKGSLWGITANRVWVKGDNGRGNLNVPPPHDGQVHIRHNGSLSRKAELSLELPAHFQGKGPKKEKNGTLGGRVLLNF